MSNNQIKNQHLLGELIKFFQKNGGYWQIDQSEYSNISIQWNPFIKDPRKNYYFDEIFIKRVYDVNDYINYMNKELSFVNIRFNPTQTNKE